MMDDGNAKVALERQFSVAAERIVSSLGDLHQAIDHVEEIFEPVIKSHIPTPTSDSLKTEQEQEPRSSFEGLINDIEKRVNQATGRLHDICERSAV